MTWKGIDSTDEEPITMMSVMKDEYIYIYIYIYVCVRENIFPMPSTVSLFRHLGKGLLLLRWRHTYT